MKIIDGLPDKKASGRPCQRSFGLHEAKREVRLASTKSESGIEPFEHPANRQSYPATQVFVFRFQQLQTPRPIGLLFVNEPFDSFADEWQEPVNVEVVNTGENEGWPFISQDGNELWFLRTYMGSPAIYRSVKVNGNWSPPELIVSQFAGEPTLDDQGNLYFVHHYYRDSKMIEADIYVAYRKTQ